MTDKEKAIEAIEKAWEIINDKQPETTEEINLIRFAVNTARQLISKPTLDDCIAVVEHLAYKHCPHGEYDNLVTKEILLEVYTALKGLKEGK